MNQRVVAGLTVLLAAFAALVVFSGATQAQYPSPDGSLTGTTDNPNPGPNSEALLTCEVRDKAGDPVEDAPCTFTVVSGDGEVGSKTITKNTDANGIATAVLRTGPTPGTIVISITSGDLASTVIVEVADAVSPPAAPVFQPPSTGDAGLACGSCS